MTIILFASLSEVDQRLNPYYQAGTIHNNGLDYIGTVINTLIGQLTVSQQATDYMVSTYATNVTYPQETLAIIAAKGRNATVDATNNLGGIDLNGGYSSLLQEVFSFIDNFPPSMAASTIEKSYVIFSADYSGFWADRQNLLLDRILDSGLSADQMILPLVAQSILANSYIYWNNAYNNAGGSNLWYDFITDAISSVDDIDWRQLIQQDIKGAVLGAFEGGINNPTNVAGGIVTGAAIAGMAASAQNILIQRYAIAAYDPV